jgi:hypothetical protein
MTAAEILRLNGNLRDSPMMEVVRRFHALIGSRELPYCVVGGMAEGSRRCVRTYPQKPCEVLEGSLSDL